MRTRRHETGRPSGATIGPLLRSSAKAVWLHRVFNLNLRDIERFPTKRGITSGMKCYGAGARSSDGALALRCARGRSGPEGK